MSQDKQVYTLGAYEDNFAQHKTVEKLGPLPASKVPSGFPASFLEKDGSYGGGKVFRTIEQAQEALNQYKDEKLNIYLLDAEWDQDTYEIHPNDFRINHAVKVLEPVQVQSERNIRFSK